MLQISDGDHMLGYAIDTALDVVSLPSAMAPASVPGPLAGVVALDGEQVEVLDPFWLFGEEGRAGVARPTLCLLQADASGWMRGFLRPTLEAAGYRVVTTLAPGEVADVALALDDTPVATTSVPLVTLCRRQGAAAHDQVYRYDRAGVLAAVAAAARRSA